MSSTFSMMMEDPMTARCRTVTVITPQSLSQLQTPVLGAAPVQMLKPSRICGGFSGLEIIAKRPRWGPKCQPTLASLLYLSTPPRLLCSYNSPKRTRRAGGVPQKGPRRRLTPLPKTRSPRATGTSPYQIRTIPHSKPPVRCKDNLFRRHRREAQRRILSEGVAGDGRIPNRRMYPPAMGFSPPT